MPAYPHQNKQNKRNFTTLQTYALTSEVKSKTSTKEIHRKSHL